MFLRLVTDSFTRRPRRQLLTGAALALGMAVATAAISVALDVGNRLALEFRSLGANLVVTPTADSLPLEIGGVDYRPANAGAYLPESDLPKIKEIFWHNNIIAFAPILETPMTVGNPASVPEISSDIPTYDVQFLGTWARHTVPAPDGSNFVTGIAQTDPWWRVRGRWFEDNVRECVVGMKLAKRLGVSPGSYLMIFRHNNGGEESSDGLTVVGVLETGGPEDDQIVGPLSIAQSIANKPQQYRKLYVSALTKPEDEFGRRDPSTLSQADYDRWFCTPYISSIAYQLKQALPGTDVRIIRRVADTEGAILSHVEMLLWLVTLASLLAAGLAVGASSAASVIERRTEIGLMKALGAGSANIGLLLAAEQLLLAFVGGGIGYSLGLILARIVGDRIFGAPPEPSLLVLVVVLVLAAGVTLFGSALPLRRAAHYDPAPILRGE
ncbi:MAG TPA: ABC transporter permease [Terriglobales bacterium]|nr:ABC transporter permease [Terriglobales bacterium]